MAGEEGGGASPGRPLRDREAELEAELEELRRWNEALQARLDESSRRTRHVGVGMEKGGRVSVQCQTAERGGGGVSEERYAELTREMDRLLAELEREREKSEAERRQQEVEVGAVQQTLRAAEGKVQDLEGRLRAAALRDAGTSAEQLAETERLVGELEGARASAARLRGQLEGAQGNLRELRGQHEQGQAAAARLRGQVEGLQGTISDLRARLESAQRSGAELRGRLRFESEENRRLREELADLSAAGSGQSTTSSSPRKEEEGLAATSSLPNLLLTPGGGGNKLDSWTSPPSLVAERLDVSALKAKNEDITRLNAELQRKCQEKLLRTPPHSRPSSAGQGGGAGSGGGGGSWKVRVRETEETLRSEMAERERALTMQLREAEARLLDKEAEWQAKLAGLRQEGVELEMQLAQAMKDKQSLRAKVAEKDEEILK